MSRPTGLDPQVRHLIWGRLRELKQSGTTLLLTTHFMEEAERLCDDIVIMDHGVILSKGHPKQLIKQHVEPEVVEIHGEMDALPGILTEHDIHRVEIVGETIYYFTSAPEEIIRRVENKPDVHYLHRPANLEDVFLRLTGPGVEGGLMLDWRLPRMRRGMIHVWRRNLLVWRKLLVPSLLLNFGEPFLYLLGLGLGLGRFVGELGRIAVPDFSRQRPHRLVFHEHGHVRRPVFSLHAHGPAADL